jgi:hypothetical protein
MMSALSDIGYGVLALLTLIACIAGAGILCAGIVTLGLEIVFGL